MVSYTILIGETEMIELILIMLIALVLFVTWAEILYYFAGKDKRVLFTIVFSIGLFGTAITSAWNMLTSSNAYTIFISALILFFVIFWGSTLYEQAGNKEKRWYYLTLIIPILAIVYQFVKK